MNNKFNSKDNEKVINIAENHGDIMSGEKEAAKKNMATVTNEHISGGSTVYTHIYQNTPQENNQKLNNNQPLFILAGLIIFALSVVSIFAVAVIGDLWKNKEQVNTNAQQNAVTPNISANNPNTNTQPTVTPINTNVTINNSSQGVAKEGKKSIATQSKATQTRTPDNNVNRHKKNANNVVKPIKTPRPGVTPGGNVNSLESSNTN
jgi:hypothetical protein